MAHDFTKVVNYWAQVGAEAACSRVGARRGPVAVLKAKLP